MIRTLIAIHCSFLVLAACEGDRPPAASAPTNPHAVTIMTFNVENLFDSRDEPGKNDNTFLPASHKRSDGHIAACRAIENEFWRDQCLNWDWSDSMVEAKLGAVARSILQVDGGRGPDIVALQEVENVGILERLRTEYLADAGYRPAILIEGDDRRGIDVAFLSRLETDGEAVLHQTDFSAFEAWRVEDTRGILETTFVLPDGTLLTGFAVHFPAPFHPTAMRAAAYRHLNELKAALPPGRPAFAAGDFNTTAREKREQGMLERFVRTDWVVAHESGCEGCKGTQYYPPDDSWSFLDMILWSPGRGAQATWQLGDNSAQIANAAAGQVSPDGTPARFTVPAGDGVSDHWPLVVTIESK